MRTPLVVLISLTACGGGSPPTNPSDVKGPGPVTVPDTSAPPAGTETLGLTCKKINKPVCQNVQDKTISLTVDHVDQCIKHPSELTLIVNKATPGQRFIVIVPGYNGPGTYSIPKDPGNRRVSVESPSGAADDARANDCSANCKAVIKSFGPTGAILDFDVTCDQLCEEDCRVCTETGQPNVTLHYRTACTL